MILLSMQQVLLLILQIMETQLLFIVKLTQPQARSQAVARRALVFTDPLAL
jgi:hypothetical protein